MPPKRPARKKAPKLPAPHFSSAAKRERFIAEYLLDPNATQSAIKAGYSPHTAYSSGQRLLKRVDVATEIARRQQKVLQPLIDRYEATAPQITREFALLGFSNMADYFAVGEDGQPVLDLSEATRDHFAAIQAIKTKRTIRHVGETMIEDVTTELRLAPKREALTELAKIRGMLKDGGDVVVPVRFIVQWGDGPKPEPYPDELIEGEAA